MALRLPLSRWGGVGRKRGRGLRGVVLLMLASGRGGRLSGAGDVGPRVILDLFEERKHVSFEIAMVACGID